jgi:acyl-coenzyme A synthetase/AMP-(fatty) acid ligase
MVMAGKNIRGLLAADPELGAGNVLIKLLEHGAEPDGPGITFDVAVDGHDAFVPINLGQLRDRVAARAASLRGHGIGWRDPVAVYVASAADCFLTFMACNWLGAIPALMNPNIPGDIAAEYIRRLRGVALVTDAEHIARLGGEDPGVPVIDAAGLGASDPASAPDHYRHHDDDPIAITHSSGTTRMPTAVVHTHASLFAATRRIRLSVPRAQGTERVLSALPAPHTAGILTVNQALCNRSELLFLSKQDDPADLLDRIEQWRPTGVFGFAVTWAELARFDLTERDLDSVAIWFNTGDCAHEAHIRPLVAAGSHNVVTREGTVRIPGSTFVDGIGSTEMGHAAFHISHRADTDRYGRCVGRPHVFADIKLFDLATGAEVPNGVVGHCAMKAPTIAPGYWNDSVSTYRNRFQGYYLTGDLMYRDDDGYYYHMDRAVDATDLGDGTMLYTAMTEERILAHCPEVRDCTVVTVRDGARVVADVLLSLVPGADPDADRLDAVRAALDPAVARAVRSATAVADDALITGPTGKVRKFLMRQRHLAQIQAG